MSKGHQGRNPPKGERIGGHEWPEVMNLSQALRYLGVSHHKITALVHRGLLPFTRNELDHRVKLVRKSDLDALRGKARPEWPE